MKVVLIIEDDFPFALEIEMMLTEVGGYLPKIVSTYAEALEMLLSLKPDIILSDVFLDNGHSVFDILSTTQRDIPLILFSSEDSDEVYEKAKSLNSYIFLIKPFNVRSLRSAMENVLNKENSSSNSFFIRSGGKHISVTTDDIIYIESEGNYSNIHTINAPFTTRATFDNLLAKFDDRMLVRVHRGYIVHIHQIQSVNTGNNMILLKNQVKIPIGRKYKSSLKAIIN